MLPCAFEHVRCDGTRSHISVCNTYTICMVTTVNACIVSRKLINYIVTKLQGENIYIVKYIYALFLFLVAGAEAHSGGTLAIWEFTGIFVAWRPGASRR